MTSVTDLQAILSVIATLVSLTTLIVSITQAVMRSKESAKKLERMSEDTFNETIDSNDIDKIGTYIDNDLGRVTLREYSQDAKIQARVSKIIERIEEYVGTEKSVGQKDFEREKESGKYQKIVEKGPLSREFQSILDELKDGEPWNALARLRRHIEIMLRKLLEKNGIPFKMPISMKQMISLLHDKEIIDKQVTAGLIYVTRLANVAIHGYDIEAAEAEEAILIAAKVLKDIDSGA